MWVGLLLLITTYPAFFVMPNHPARNLSNSPWAGPIYFGMFLLGIVLFWRGSRASMINKYKIPKIYACESQGVIGACCEEDYQRDMEETSRLRRVLGNIKYRPKPTLMALFTDNTEAITRLGKLRSGSRVDFEIICDDCQVRWVDMQVPRELEPGRPAINLEHARSLLRGDGHFFSASQMIQSADKKMAIATALAAALFLLVSGWSVWKYYL